VYDAGGLQIPGQYDLIRQLRAAGEESRVAPSLPMKLVMGDARIAIVPLETSPEVIEVAAVVHASALLESLHALFELVWDAATPVGDEPGPAVTGAPTLDDTDRRVLELLTLGLTDKAVARQLGVTERTIQRRSQRIMAAYGVRNRLQLGIRLGREPGRRGRTTTGRPSETGLD
jgi:DNA-binding CsgD family transcriptional regulator